jgi:methylated-DNA-[protein]-cysteine S-methyltransferase
MFYSTNHPSPVGLLTLACEGGNLVGLWIEGQKYFGDPIAGEIASNPAEAGEGDIQTSDTVKRWLDSYFAGEKPAVSELPLAPSGGEFRQRVWRILREIPYGKAITYGDIAKKIAVETNRKSMSGQAVGGAVGHNPISIIIPCHRVVGSNGSLTGYAGGLAVKAKLLELEGVDMSSLFAPSRGSAL